jgi:hypothetical protein
MSVSLTRRTAHEYASRIGRQGIGVRGVGARTRATAQVRVLAPLARTDEVRTSNRLKEIVVPVHVDEVGTTDVAESDRQEA